MENIKGLEAAAARQESVSLMLNNMGYFGLAEHAGALAMELHLEYNLAADQALREVLGPTAPPPVQIWPKPRSIGVWRGGC